MRPPVRRVAQIVLAAWLLRWFALELAAYAGRHWLPPQPPGLREGPAPGYMPGPFDR
jgi:hypothetical protein